MKRVTLRATYKVAEGDFQPGATLALDDLKADVLIKAGKAILATEQTIYTHEDEMPAKMRARALEALRVADAAGGINQQVARAAATAPFREKSK